MYIEGDSAVHGDTARLLSAECADPQPQCLQFWYHMYGSSWTMGLSVYLLQYGNVAKEVWRKREDQGNIWHLARVDLRPDVKFQVSASSWNALNLKHTKPRHLGDKEICVIDLR